VDHKVAVIVQLFADVIVTYISMGFHVTELSAHPYPVTHKYVAVCVKLDDMTTVLNVGDPDGIIVVDPVPMNVPPFPVAPTNPRGDAP
jgi:hypothetical protein